MREAELLSFRALLNHDWTTTQPISIARFQIQWWIDAKVNYSESYLSLRVITVRGEIGFSPKINVFKLPSRFWTH
jgi:hypothetical protein